MATEIHYKQALLTFAASEVAFLPEEQNHLLQPVECGNTLGQSGTNLGLRQSTE